MGQGIAALFEIYHRELKRFLIRRVRSPEIAADITQDTYLRLLRVSDTDKTDDLCRFLFTIASNLARVVAHLRRPHESRDLTSR